MEAKILVFFFIIIIPAHLDLFFLKMTILIEWRVRFRAIQDDLVASLFPGSLHRLLNQSAPDALFLMIGMDNDILDVHHPGTAMDQLAFHQQGNRGNDFFLMLAYPDLMMISQAIHSVFKDLSFQDLVLVAGQDRQQFNVMTIIILSRDGPHLFFSWAEKKNLDYG